MDTRMVKQVKNSYRRTSNLPLFEYVIECARKDGSWRTIYIADSVPDAKLAFETAYRSKKYTEVHLFEVGANQDGSQNRLLWCRWFNRKRSAMKYHDRQPGSERSRIS